MTERENPYTATETSAPRGPFVAVVGLCVVLLAALIVSLAFPRTGEPVTRPDDQVERAYALDDAARMLAVQILAAPSATAALRSWCADYQLASPAEIRAVKQATLNPVTLNQRLLLNVSETEPVEYRNVELYCGERLMSSAELWYVPSRLTPPMQEALKETDKPFGTVVAELGLSRRTDDVERLWAVLPTSWERNAATADGRQRTRDWVHANPAMLTPQPDRSMFRTEVVVSGAKAPADGRPIALTYETYKMDALAFMNER